MRILIVSPSWGTYGGIQSFSIAVANATAAVPSTEARLLLKPVKGTQMQDSLRDGLRALSTPWGTAERASFRLAAEIRAADLVHVSTPAIDVILAARAFGTKVAVTVHNHRPHNASRRRLLTYRAAIQLADRVWYNSEFVRESWGLSRSERVEKLPVVSELPTQSIDAAQRKGFVFVSRWIENKGLESLVEAYARSGLDFRQHPLTLVGDGPLRDRVESLLERHGLSDVVARPGFVSDGERNHHIASARWLVAPSNTREDLGLTPIEARHVGVPCIVTRDGGLPEAGGRHAIVCPPDDVDALASALRQAGSLSNDAYRRVAEASRAELIEGLQPLTVYAKRYREILESPS